MTIRDQTAQQVDQEVRHTAVARMFDLGNILELVDDGLDNSPLPQEDLVHHRQEPILHVRLEFRDQLEAEGLQQLLKQGVRQIALVRKDLPEEALDQARNRSAIIDVAGRQGHIQQFATVVEQQMQFEAKEPASRTLAPVRYAVKHLVLLLRWLSQTASGMESKKDWNREQRDRTTQSPKPFSALAHGGTPC